MNDTNQPPNRTLNGLTSLVCKDCDHPAFETPQALASHRRYKHSRLILSSKAHRAKNKPIKILDSATKGRRRVVVVLDKDRASIEYSESGV